MHSEVPQQSKTQVFKLKAMGLLAQMKEIILSPFRLFRFLCLVTGLLVILGSAGAGFMVYSFFASMPDMSEKSFKDLKKEATLRVHARFDKKKNREKYFWVPMEKINRELLYSVVMSEDATYFEHNGVNFNAMIDSLARNIRKRKYESGASTITQQVVKNVYLTNEKSIIRKLKEILIARDLESRFTKNEILEVYLNIIEVGPNLHGVGMGSYRFFKKPPAEVNAAEAAYMALMLPSPRRNYFSIYQNKYVSKLNRKKILRVLRDMRYLEFLSPDQYVSQKRLAFLKKL